MKFSKPGETDGETGEAGDTTEMPVVETMLTDRLSLDPKPVDEMVETNGDVLSDVFGRLGQVENRVEELEERNKQLEQQNEELKTSLRRAFEIMDKADSIAEFNLGDRDP
jgi:TolA-binding protein